MEITFLGAGCVRITTKNIAILANPVNTESGLPEVKLTNDVTLKSQIDMPSPVKAGMVIDGPGEYEVKGAMITGVPTQIHTDAAEEGRRGTAYAITVDGLRIAVLGNIAPGLKDDQVEALGSVDVLVVPVGGHGLTLSAQAAAEVVSQLEPKYVVPVYYDDGATKYPMPQEKLETFLKEVGSHPEPQSKLKVSAKDMPLETEVVVLSRQGS